MSFGRSVALLLLLAITGSARAAAALDGPSVACAALKDAAMHWPENARILTADGRPAGVVQVFRGPQPTDVAVPAHCEVVGVMHEREGAAGQHYAIHFHVRLPADWNGRFLFQGGGGTNGELGDAVGFVAPGVRPALEQGYAVVTQDAGHDNRANNVPAAGGTVSFGLDPQARADYGYASLQPVAVTAKAVVARFYGREAAKAYFVGCSKGGQEGLAFAERDPQEFDGILAGAPALSLPRAAVAQAWDVQTFAAVDQAAAPPAGDEPFSPLHRAFSDADLLLASTIILGVCDQDDGIADGMVQDFRRCTTARVMPALRRAQCAGAKTADCLTHSQIEALQRSHAGPRDSTGKALYTDWAWDPGIAAPGWRFWKLGTADGQVIALNIPLGGAALAAVFSTPPRSLAADPKSQFGFQQGFDFNRDAPKIYATDTQFRHAAWEQISARSTDLDAFRAHGGKLIIPQGVSDPVFSIDDTVDWLQEVDRRMQGRAAQFVRVFPVPGMAHCGSGPATDQYDGLSALVNWVEKKQAPDRIIASAGPATPWPNRTRPLCPFPAVARYTAGDIETAASFRCDVPKAP